jgi:DNA polymerase III psi subunit
MTTSIPRNDYLEALGIPEFLYTSEASIKPDKVLSKCLIVETTNENSFCQSGETQELLDKMLSSINLSLNDVTCLSIKYSDLEGITHEYPAQAVLIMGDYTGPQKDNIFITHHPKDIIVNANLKRQVWETLKKLKKCLK